MTDFELYSRVAWLNRDTNEYNYFARLPPSDSFQVVVLANIIRSMVII